MIFIKHLFNNNKFIKHFTSKLSADSFQIRQYTFLWKQAKNIKNVEEINQQPIARLEEEGAKLRNSLYLSYARLGIVCNKRPTFHWNIFKSASSEE